MVDVPKFDDLPPVPDMPKGCAWGVFDKDGVKDVYGTLNHLTPAVVAAAAREVRDGVSISLNWPLDALKNVPLPGRRPATHTVYTLQELGLAAAPTTGFDDELSFNTQGSSQWDSLVHWLHQASGRAYNGFAPTRDALADPAAAADLPTLDRWHARGGVVARGVLLDFTRHAGPDFHPFAGRRITPADLEAVAAAQAVDLRPGDVLVVRTGMTDAFLDPASLARLMAAAGDGGGGGGGMSGLHGTEATARWLWDGRFAAVAGDSIAVEALPPVREDGSVATMTDLVLHPYCLGMFGMPLGELWDLRALGDHCAATGRYSFLLTSVPLNVSGLVGSPANALAIF